MAADDDAPDPIEDAAARWAVEQDAGLTDEGIAALEQWLGSDSRHPPAFEKARAAWRFMGHPAIRSEVAQRRLSEPPLPGYPPVGRPGGKRKWIAPAIAASIALVVVGTIRDWPTALQSDAMTATGEQRTLTLADGSQVRLNTDSAISIDYQTDRRIVHVLKGEAAFSVARDPQRPFSVEAKGGSTTALGTRFIVDRHADTTQVTVTQHSVRVAAPGFGASTAIVKEGQSVAYGKSGIGSIHAIDANAASAWTRKRLVFVDQPLRDVVAELNRYHPGFIVIIGTDLGDRRVSGIFRTNNPVAALDTLQASLKLGSTRLTDRVIFIHR
ncbi:FecR family protein [Novosphingobium guangzhouense]|uniref:FecR protein domain-containing protein n=1 Tax=Novosphingobium guangzhouense TaxID=1850347 RepID=A0A2K2FTL1_9SPHN|nr:FecR family protein [Novosphingobium guangzhouense]PNU02129.1 hypothetical protein A8V01_09620 [Novosphingobium guangzhouense]